MPSKAHGAVAACASLFSIVRRDFSCVDETIDWSELWSSYFQRQKMARFGLSSLTEKWLFKGSREKALIRLRDYQNEDIFEIRFLPNGKTGQVGMCSKTVLRLQVHLKRCGVPPISPNRSAIETML